MKYALMLILTISLSGQAYSFETAVARTAAPSSDEPSTGSSRTYEQDRTYHDYDNSDTVQTGQSATKREYQYDTNFKSCRTMNGVWLRTGDKGYAACMDSTQTLKK